MKPSIEFQIESEWVALCDTGQDRRTGKPYERTYFITCDGQLVHGKGAAGFTDAQEIGTFTRRITLADFRDEVFHVYSQIRGARCR